MYKIVPIKFISANLNSAGCTINQSVGQRNTVGGKFAL